MASNDPQIFDAKLLSQEQKKAILDVIKKFKADDSKLRVAKLLEFGRLPNEASKEDLRFGVACSTLADLLDQGWQVFTRKSDIYIQAPPTIDYEKETVQEAKARFRESLYRSSNRQLSEISVETFLKVMEKPQPFKGKNVSILSLVDDGEDLASELRKIQALNIEQSEIALNELIIPTIQVCGKNDKCNQTGLKLLDMWRYFRYTWSLEYNSVPGRTLRILIRNKARKNWPIIGIAMLASPAANMYSRDSWIGWRTEDLVQNIVDGEWKASEVAKGLMSVLRESIVNIRTDDLVSDIELEEPTLETFFKLDQIIEKAQKLRDDDLRSLNNDNRKAGYLIDIRDYKSKDFRNFSNQDWKDLSSTSLFIKKRAEQLKPLLKTLDYFKKADFETAPAAALMETLITTEGKKHISFALNEIRKLKLSSEIADISVCGAIQPYNHILGGKLVTIIMSSQEIRDAYKKRYEGQPSEIASQIAGRKVFRDSNLKVVTTTSLYGVGSSQYNRIKLSSDVFPFLKSSVHWKELKKSDGFSVTHVSPRTVRLMRDLAIKEYGRRRINSVFGEGSSPRTRQIRSGLNLIGISDEHPLRHSVGRRVYACELYPGARRTLIGLSGKSRKLRSNTIKSLTQAWIKRWIINRIKHEHVIAAVESSKPKDISQGFKDRIRSVRIESI